MDEVEQIAKDVFVALMQGEAVRGGKPCLESLASKAFVAAEVFIETRDRRQYSNDVFGSQAVERV